MRVTFHRLAEAEYLAACQILARSGPARRERFIQAVADTVRRIAVNPESGSPAFGEYRWALVRRYKYLLFYRQVAADHIFVYAVAHARRRPGYWRRRVNRP